MVNLWGEGPCLFCSHLFQAPNSVPRDYKVVSMDFSRGVEGKKEGRKKEWMDGSGIKLVKVKHQKYY